MRTCGRYLLMEAWLGSPHQAFTGREKETRLTAGGSFPDLLEGHPRGVEEDYLDAGASCERYQKRLNVSSVHAQRAALDINRARHEFVARLVSSSCHDFVSYAPSDYPRSLTSELFSLPIASPKERASAEKNVMSPSSSTSHAT